MKIPQITYVHSFDEKTKEILVHCSINRSKPSRHAKLRVTSAEARAYLRHMAVPNIGAALTPDLVLTFGQQDIFRFAFDAAAIPCALIKPKKELKLCASSKNSNSEHIKYIKVIEIIPYAGGICNETTGSQVYTLY